MNIITIENMSVASEETHKKFQAFFKKGHQANYSGSLTQPAAVALLLWLSWQP